MSPGSGKSCPPKAAVRWSRSSASYTPSEVIPMDAPPVEALRTYKDSSLVRMAEIAAAGEVDAVVSAGNTGACAAVCQLKLKPLPCVTRPGIAVTIPSFRGPVCYLRRRR